MFDASEHINYIVALLGSFFSLLFSGFIIFMYSTKEEFQSYSCKFIRYLCI